MKACHYLLFLTLLSSPLSYAGAYLELSPALVIIDSPAASSEPLLADFRLGYSMPAHQFELALMSGLNDDRLNRLTLDVPSVVSVFYHYIPRLQSALQLHLIVGASQVEVESSYPGIADSSDRFTGVSYGIGFEEAFRFNPRVKISLDWIRLYRGDRIDIDVTSLGVHYEF